MFASTLSVLLLALSATAIKIDTPAINQCKSVDFSISEAVGDVHLAVVPVVNPCSSDALVELGPINIANGKYTWNSANVPAGTKVFVVVDDSTGAEGWTQAITVGGSASDCPASSSAKPSSSSSSARGSQTSAPVNAANSPNTGKNAASLTAPIASGALTLAAGFIAAVSLF